MRRVFISRIQNRMLEEWVRLAHKPSRRLLRVIKSAAFVTHQTRNRSRRRRILKAKPSAQTRRSFVSDARFLYSGSPESPLLGQQGGRESGQHRNHHIVVRENWSMLSRNSDKTSRFAGAIQFFRANRVAVAGTITCCLGGFPNIRTIRPGLRTDSSA